MPTASIVRFHARTPGMPGRFERLRFIDQGANDGTAGAAGAASGDTGASGAGSTSTDTGAGAADSQGGASGAPEGFPANTPWRDMKPEEQAAYWQHQARRHEARANRAADYDAVVAERDRLRSQTQTAEERALTEAREAGKAEARAAALPRLLQAEFRAAATGRLNEDQLRDVTDPLDPQKFLTSEGEVDTDKVKRFVDGIAPAGDPKRWPSDMGQGRRTVVPQNARDAGRAAAARRFGQKTTTTS